MSWRDSPPTSLPHVLLPIGEMKKSDVRELAKNLGLPVHDKPDSQEICFIPDDDYAGFVRSRRPGRETAGVIVEEDGTLLGHHAGIEGFTIGQRRGLGVTVGAPRYVVEIEPIGRVVTVGPRRSLEKSELEASGFRWQAEPPNGPSPCLAQIRARHQAAPAVVENLGEGRVRVRFESPQSAVAPGQLVAVYQGDRVWGGGRIDAVLGVGSS